MPQNGSESSFGHFLVVRNRNAAKGRLRISKHYVASFLSIQHVPDLLQGTDQFPARYDREPAPPLYLDDLFGDRRGDRFPVGLQALHKRRNRFTYVRQSLFTCRTLAYAARKARHLGHEGAVLILLD